ANCSLWQAAAQSGGTDPRGHRRHLGINGGRMGRRRSVARRTAIGQIGRDVMKRVNIERILCPIDFSEFSRDALDQAVAMGSWSRATLTVMHVIDMPQAPLGGLPAGSEAFAPVFDRGKVAEDVKAFAEPAIGSAGVRWDVVAAFGPPAMSIQLHAEHIH